MSKHDTKKKGGDLVGWMQDKLNPPEMHLPGYQYCGPFTKLSKRLTRGDPGVNRVDKACKKHDIAYSQTKDTRQRHVADEELLKDLATIENPNSGFYPLGEKQARAVIRPIIKTKKVFGLGSIVTYCLICKKKTGTLKVENSVTSNGRPVMKGECEKCGSRKSSFLKLTG